MTVSRVIGDGGRPPSLFRSYGSILFRRRKGVPVDGVLPEIEFGSEGVVASAESLDAYCRLCGFDDSSVMPPTYPYVLAGSLQLALIAHADFPIKGAGLLHLRNHIRQNRAIGNTEHLCIKVTTGAGRFRPQGFEFDLLTTAEVDDKIVWSCTSTFLKRGTFAKEDAASELENTVKRLEDEQAVEAFAVPADIGRKYAGLCGDYNPIHVSNLLAKLFGMKRSIAHGMWVAGKSLSGLTLPEGPIAIDIAFKGPVFSASQVSLSQLEQGGRLYFNLFCGSNPRPVILGTIAGQESGQAG